jgi:CRISPR-associated protein Csm4
VDSYRLRFTLAGPTATPWQADTLWGHLCWALRRRRGEAALAGFLGSYAAGEPPIVLSDGYPEGRLLRPLLPPPNVSGEKRAAILAARRAKAAAGTFVDLDTFDLLRRAPDSAIRNPQSAFDAPAQRRILVQRNQIDRRTNTAGGEGGALFTVAEHHAAVVDVYVRLAAGVLPLLRELLDDLQHEGYGKRRVVGYGAIAGWDVTPFGGFAPFPEADAFMTLCRFVPAAADPADGMWRTAIKVGTVGGETATPFKRPLVALTAGAWFRAPGGGREWYGRLVGGVSAAHPEVVQYGLAFPVPMRAPAESTEV